MNQGAIADSRRKYLFIGASLLLYLLACATPCLEVSKKGDELWYGLRILVIGWLGLLVGQFAWLANPLWAGAMIFFAFRRWTAAQVLSALALFFAVQTLILFGTQLPGDEGNVTKFEVVRLRFGFYLWMASLIVLFAGAFAMKRRSHTQSF